MTSSDSPLIGEEYIIDHMLNIMDAKYAHASLAGATAAATPQAPLRLELTGVAATATAIQLIICGARSLAEAAAFSGFGPLASDVLNALSDNILVHE